MRTIVKKFNDLSIDELYSILKLRSEVFVVEQDCVYLDIDDKDQKALHVFIKKDDLVIGYTRLFDKGYYFDEASIGRVVTHQDYRKDGLGHVLMKDSIEVIKRHYNTSKITLSAQKHLKKFYESHEFFQEGEEYLEDGIPHIRMKRN